MEDKRIPPFPLRMEPDLRERLEQLAKANGRSLNKEIVAILENAVSSSTSEKLTLEQINERLSYIEDAVNELRNKP